MRRHIRKESQIERNWLKSAVEGKLVEQLEAEGIILDTRNPSARLTANENQINRILDEFYAPMIGERGCTLDPNNISFETLRAYLFTKVNYQTLLANAEASEQDAYLPKHTASEQQSPVYEPVTA